MSRDQRFKEKVILVTGAARGIGRAQAEAFVQGGAQVVIADINKEQAAETAKELGEMAIDMVVDVSDEKSVSLLFSQIETELGALDVLVNNAALMLDIKEPFKPFWEIEIGEWQRTFDVNSTGVFLCALHARKLLEKSSGSIVNITSDAIWAGYQGQLAYFASKGSVAVMTRCLARELGDFGIRVNAVAPGLTESEKVQTNEFLQSLKPMIIADRALKREQTPFDVAEVVLFLASNQARAISGQIVVVNSGGLMR